MSDAQPLRQAWRLVGGPAPRGPYTQLVGAARALEVEYLGAPVLSLTLNGMPLELSLVIDSGTVTGLKVRLALERSPGASDAAIRLRKETADDREGKARGISREVQLDDKEFDDAVYVDATASDAEVRRIFAKPSRRRAVLALLDSGASLELMPAAVTASWPTRRAADPFEPERVKHALRDVLVLAGVAGPRGRARGRRGGWLQVLSAFGIFLTPMYLLFVLVAWSFEGGLVWLGFGAGLAAAVAVRGLVARLTRGDPASYERYRSTAGMLGFSLVMLGGSVPVHLNASVNRSTLLSKTTGRVVAVGSYDDEGGTYSVDVAWDGGPLELVNIGPTVKVGDTVVKREYRGALGFRWGERPRVENLEGPP